MTTQPVGNWGKPLFPKPPLTEMALRVAVKSLDLAAAVHFENEFHAAWQEAMQTDSTVPMHTFLHRYPTRAARLTELERRVAQATTREAARDAAIEASALLDEAARELVP